VLTGIGIRAIVETVCKERSASGKNLEEKIDQLAAKNLVTAEGAEVLHGLRFLGNGAAHDMKPHTPEELATAFLVVEHLLQTVYIVTQLANQLPRKQPTPPPSS
jgi:hypothetical protein